MIEAQETKDYQDLLQQLDFSRLPRHIAIIMDGNGRWAEARGKLRSYGHRAGAEALRQAVEICREIGVEVLTAYAFSTENWKRPKEEVDFLMRLLNEYLKKELANFNRQEIRVRQIGEAAAFRESVRRQLAQTIAATQHHDKMTLNLALNYGGRQEIVQAARRLMAEAQAGRLQPAELDEQLFASYLDTAGQPDPDLLIRPSGEQRLSNYLLWQSAYTEFFFPEKLWPDFTKRDLLQAVLAYQRRDRRFGAVKSEPRQEGAFCNNES